MFFFFENEVWRGPPHNFTVWDRAFIFYMWTEEGQLHLPEILLFPNSISVFCYRCSKLGNFQNWKKQDFFGRQFIWQEAQAKNKKKNSAQRCARTSSIKKNTIISFLSKKNRPKSGPPWTLFPVSEIPRNRPAKFRGVFLFFSKTCQNSPNCRKNISRPVMNSPGIGLPPPGIYI